MGIETTIDGVIAKRAPDFVRRAVFQETDKMTSPEACMRITELPSHAEALSDDRALMQMATALYGLPESEIADLKRDHGFSWSEDAVARADVRFRDGTRSAFYYKNSFSITKFNRGMMEAAGMAVANLLAGPTYLFAINKYPDSDDYHSLVMEDVGGLSFQTLMDRNYSGDDFTEKSARSYARAETLASFLLLDDRHNGNVFINDTGTIVNIDFDAVFTSKHSEDWEFGELAPSKKYAMQRDCGNADAIVEFSERYRTHRRMIKEILALGKASIVETGGELIGYFRGSPHATPIIEVLDSYVNRAVKAA